MKRKIIELLIPVICNKGYSEMSISCIANATKLKKSSIYHFFPEGKSQIALEIILYVDEILSAQFNEIISNDAAPKVKYYKLLDALSDFYQFGKRNCLLDVTTIANANPKIQTASKNLLNKLINTFYLVFTERGLNKQEAEQKAVEVITLIQGSLILCRATEENKLFLNLIKSLKSKFDLLDH
ncbi:TetR/AcrR family transcriptional regulator [Candidatus Phycorickettsia trachydisci]|nr:TetR/AcrR family transcriptional regulator [Candidatus Phycorickettsia trachydisci]